MANAKVTVELSQSDRQLLRDIRDAIQALGSKEQEAIKGNVRLAEGGFVESSVDTVPAGVIDGSHVIPRTEVSPKLAALLCYSEFDAEEYGQPNWGKASD